MALTTTKPKSSGKSSATNLRDVPTRKLQKLPWKILRRPEQRPPRGDWRIWYVRGGRGGGKTRTGAETLNEWIEANPGHDWAIVAPTYADARDTCMEGASGLLAALKLTRSYAGWNRSQGELRLPTGGMVWIDGADDGALRIQGKNLAGLWADEVGLWRQWKLAWDESIAFAVRIDPALIIATGTPKRGHPLVKRLMADDTVAETLLRTMDNAPNLSRVALAELRRRYEGTELGRQELEGDILGDVPGALVKREQIQYGTAPRRHHNGDLIPDYSRIVVAIDPAGTYGPDSDETGIVVAGSRESLGFVIDDLSGRFSPTEWAKRAVRAYEENSADAIIVERNYGGDMVRHTLQSVGFTGHVIEVVASRGKTLRAEPVTAKYEQGLIYHVRPFPELEDQLCSYTPDTKESPDRMDALVWAFTELLVGPVISGPMSLIA
jgi:predicted phage terminase large subunit-like protein